MIISGLSWTNCNNIAIHGHIITCCANIWRYHCHIWQYYATYRYMIWQYYNILYLHPHIITYYGHIWQYLAILCKVKQLSKRELGGLGGFVYIYVTFTFSREIRHNVQCTFIFTFTFMLWQPRDSFTFTLVSRLMLLQIAYSLNIAWYCFV